MAAVCEICGGTMARTHHAREMMFGRRESFTYGECGACEGLQLLDTPADLSKYYGETYYSFSSTHGAGRVRRIARRLRANATFRGHDRLARAIGLGAPLPMWPQWLREAGIDRGAAICDVGCGSGESLVNMGEHGFTNLTGADAFIPETMRRRGIPIYKATPQELVGRYDFVMLNHSFEHMPNPHATLATLRSLLNPGGTVMLRMPVAGCWAWREYGVNWVALDAPRHLFILSAAGVDVLAAACGLQCYSVIYDSTAIQFWRSEQYLADIPLQDPRSHAVNPEVSPFTDDQIAAWERDAQKLNEAGDGDTAAFFLRAMPNSE